MVSSRTLRSPLRSPLPRLQPPPRPGRRLPLPRRPRRHQQESEASVPKMKTHKGAQKRIGVTGSGKFIRVKSWRGHHLELKSSRRTRRYAGKVVMGPESQEQLRGLLPYAGK